MTEALNFTPKALDDLRSMAGRTFLTEFDREGVDFIADVLSRAEVFVLPDAGQLLERNKPRPQVPGIMFCPPFPAVALEYRGAERDWHDPVFEQIRCSKRISLAWLWDGNFPIRGVGQAEPGFPQPGEAVAIASIVYIDDRRMWVPVPAAVLLPFDAIYEKPRSTAFREAMRKTGRITKAQYEADALRMEYMLPILPSTIATVATRDGFEAAIEMIGADLMDEVNAYLDTCLALACTNVHAVRQPRPEKLNRARIKAGKVPLKDFHVLNVGGHDLGSVVGDGGSGGRRAHLRRGHIRRLGPERVTWVNACIVAGNRPGFAEKNYSMGVRG